MRSDDNHLVFNSLRFWVFSLEKKYSLSDPGMIAVDLGNSMRDLSYFTFIFFIFITFSSKNLPMQFQTTNFHPINEQDQHCSSYTLLFSKSLLWNQYFIRIRNVNKLSQNVTGIDFFVKNLLALFDWGSFNKVSWLVCSVLNDFR